MTSSDVLQDVFARRPGNNCRWRAGRLDQRIPTIAARRGGCALGILSHVKRPAPDSERSGAGRVSSSNDTPMQPPPNSTPSTSSRASCAAWRIFSIFIITILRILHALSIPGNRSARLRTLLLSVRPPRRSSAMCLHLFLVQEWNLWISSS